MTETSAPQGAVPQSDCASQYVRLFEAAECKTQVELATLLEVRQSSISDAKRRQSVPASWLEKLFEKKQINPQWIRTGLGGKTVEATSDAGETIPFITVIGCRPVEECTTEELLAEIVRRSVKDRG